MPYVERRDGVIVGYYERLQPGYAEEFTEDDPPAPPTLFGDATGVVLGALHERLVALETKMAFTRADIPHDAFGDYSRQNLAPEPDEEEGQPAASEIFTEEDLEALGDVAVGAEAVETPGDDGPAHLRDDERASGGGGHGDDAVEGDAGANAASSDASVSGNDTASQYPGIALLEDDLGRRRNQVLAAITTEKLTRLKIAMDPSQAAFLSERFAEYQNRGALGLDIDEALNADRQAYLDMRDRQQAIYYFAMQLEQSALDGDMDRLSAMHAGLSDGWP